MDLTDRYLAAISVLLPGRQREDISAELRDALMTRREEREAELGRPLTADDEVALLRGFGHPLAVAARYGEQQYLIGPELYPHYAFALKALLAIIALSAVIVGVQAQMISPGQPAVALVSALRVLWQGSISAVGVLTLIAIALQRWNIRLRVLDDWNPRDLPKPIRFRRETRYHHLAGIIAHTLFVLWWTHALPFWIPYVTHIPLKPGEHLDVSLAPIWTTLFWPVLGLSLGVIAVRVLKLMGEPRARTAHGLELALQAPALVVAGLALGAGDWVRISASGLTAHALDQVRYGVNIGIQIGLIVLAVTAACLAAYDVWWLYRNKPQMV